MTDSSEKQRNQTGPSPINLVNEAHARSAIRWVCREYMATEDRPASVADQIVLSMLDYFDGCEKSGIEFPDSIRAECRAYAAADERDPKSVEAIIAAMIGHFDGRGRGR